MKNSDILIVETNNMNPTELFEEFLNESVYDMIVEDIEMLTREK